MDDYFDSEINHLNNEILQLKTSGQKSASATPTIAKTVVSHFNLKLDDIGISAVGEVNYKMVIDSDSLIMATLNKYYDDVSKAGEYPALTREYWYVLKRKTNGDYIIQTRMTGNADDVEVLRNGGTVEASITLTVRCTNDFTLEEQ